MARRLKLKKLMERLELEARQNRGRVSKVEEETVEKDKSRKRKKKGPKKFNVHVNAPQIN